MMAAPLLFAKRERDESPTRVSAKSDYVRLTKGAYRFECGCEVLQSNQLEVSLTTSPQFAAVPAVLHMNAHSYEQRFPTCDSETCWS